MKNYNKTNNNLKALFLMLVAFLFLNGSVFGQAITYSFANAAMTDGSGGAGTTHYEVDIMIATDTNFKLGIGQFYIDYNSAAFGTNIFGGNLTFNHPDGIGGTYILDERVFGGATNAYNIPVLANNTTTKLSIAWTQAQSESAISTNVTIAGSPTKLAHLIIEYVDNNEDPMLTFDAVLSQDLTYTAGSGPLGSGGTQITNDTFDSSGSSLPVSTVNTWTGATDSDWGTAGNWSEGTVPTGTSDVMIPGGVTVPIAASDVSVNELTIASGAGLTVNGNLTNNGTTIINSGGSLIVIGTTSGSVTYNRTLNTTNWYLLASPFTGQSVVNFTTNNSLALGSGTGVAQNIALAPYDNTQVNVNDQWDYYTFGQVDGIGGDDTTDNVVRGKGYSVKPLATGDISFTGTLPSTGFAQIAITDGAANTYNLVGNPYASYLSANDNANFANLLKTNISRLTEATLWFWDQSVNTGAGGYIAVNQATASRFIAPGQGFFVSASANGNLNLGSGMFSHQSTEVFNRTTNTRPEIQLKLSNGAELSTTDIYYIEGTTLGFDNGYDSTMFNGVANDFSVYTHLLADSEGQNFAIQSLPDSGYQTMIIPVGVAAISSSEITFTATTMNIPVGLKVYLEDRDTGVFTNLSEINASYTVILDTDLNGIGRFYIHTTDSVLSIGNILLENVNIYKTTNTNLRITGLQNGTTSVKLYSILGQQVLGSTFEANSVNDIMLPSLLRAGVYIVQLKNTKGTTTQKIIIE